MTQTTTGSFDERLDALFAADSDAIATSHVLWRELRESAPVYRHGSTTIISSYELVKDSLYDDEHLSNDASRRGSRADAAFAQLTTDEQRNAFREVMQFESQAMVRNDGAEHRRLRGAAAGAMTPRRIQEVMSAIDRHADAALALFPDDSVIDLKLFSSELPLRVICDLMGVPDEDRQQIRDWGTALGGNRHGTDPDALVAAYRALLEIRDYVEGLVERYRGSVDGADQLVTLLMQAHGAERITADEVVSIFVQLLQAGHDTTSNVLSIGLYELLKAPDQWQAVVDDPSLIPNAVEEMLRVVSPAQAANRRCVVPIEIGAVELAPDDTVLALLAAANRDPAIFPDPDRFDVRRREAKRHLALSFGPHFCLGASLTRAETAVAVRKLAERFPKLHLATDGLRFRGPWQLRRPVEVPVATGLA